MPCRVEEPWESNVRYHSSEAEKAQALAEKWKKIADKLTLENDMLREGILAAAEKAPKAFTATFLKKVNLDQIAHRKEDLRRLEKVFRASKDAEKLGKVMLADPNKPLEKQLGFDPDAY
jgi:hypothetical protein